MVTPITDGITYFRDPEPGFYRATVIDFLQSLPGPTVIDITGDDETRTRVISTLIHGNEPSGLFAMRRWLRTGKRPRTNLRFLVSSVAAARRSPLFSSRFTPGEKDLNRCFTSVGAGPEYRRAEQIRAAVLECKPECIVDLHNTSGSGPAFAVTVKDSKSLRSLASLFCRRMILTGLRLGALMEVETDCPILTIECGGAEDDESHEVALSGISELAQVDDFRQGHHHRLVEVLEHPMRVELRDGASLDYHYTRNEKVDVSMCADIEHCNTGITAKGTRLGWVNAGGLGNFRIRNDQGNDVTSAILQVSDGLLVAACDLRIFMATTREDIARSDCLFYVVPVA